MVKVPLILYFDISFLNFFFFNLYVANQLGCCPTSYSANPCSFLTSAAAAAIFRNVTYVHGGGGGGGCNL